MNNDLIIIKTFVKENLLPSKSKIKLDISGLISGSLRERIEFLEENFPEWKETYERFRRHMSIEKALRNVAFIIDRNL